LARSSGTIAGILVVSERAVEKHVGNIFSKLALPPSDADHRRVLAVLRYLESDQPWEGDPGPALAIEG
jgi:DNA-binding NarL/FixJ family response regulator